MNPVVKFYLLLITEIGLVLSLLLLGVLVFILMVRQLARWRRRFFSDAAPGLPEKNTGAAPAEKLFSSSSVIEPVLREPLAPAGQPGDHHDASPIGAMPYDLPEYLDRRPKEKKRPEAAAVVSEEAPPVLDNDGASAQEIKGAQDVAVLNRDADTPVDKGGKNEPMLGDIKPVAEPLPPMPPPAAPLNVDRLQDKKIFSFPDAPKVEGVIRGQEQIVAQPLESKLQSSPDNIVVPESLVTAPEPMVKKDVLPGDGQSVAAKKVFDTAPLSEPVVAATVPPADVTSEKVVAPEPVVVGGIGTNSVLPKTPDVPPVAAPPSAGLSPESSAKKKEEFGRAVVDSAPPEAIVLPPEPAKKPVVPNEVSVAPVVSARPLVRDRFNVFSSVIASPFGRMRQRPPVPTSAPAPMERVSVESLPVANVSQPTEDTPPPPDLFFHGAQEASRFSIKKLFKKSIPLRKEVRYHYDKYKLKAQDLDELQKDLVTKYGRTVNKKEYIQEINKIVDQEKHQRVFDPKGWKEVLRLREEERVLKEIGGLKGLIGQHKKIMPRYHWTDKMMGNKSSQETHHHQDFLKNIGKGPNQK